MYRPLNKNIAPGKKSQLDKRNHGDLYSQQNTLMNNYTAKMSLVPDD